MLAHDTVAIGETEPGAAFALLRGKEGIKDSWQYFWRYPHAIVADRNQGILARLQFRVGAAESFVECRQLQADTDVSHAFNCIASVEAKVEYHLFDLRFVCPDEHRAGYRIDVNAETGRHCPTQQFAHFVHERLQVHWFRVGRLLSAQGCEFRGQVHLLSGDARLESQSFELGGSFHVAQQEHQHQAEEEEG